MAQATASAGTITSEAFTGSTDAWASPSNAASSNDVYATAAVNTVGDISEYLRCTGFGFALPTNASIQGIELLVEWRGRDGGFDAVARQHRARIIKAGSISSDTTFDASTGLPTTDTVTTIGTTTSLWGTTWTAADINSSSFGVAVAVKAAASGTPGTASIDHVRLRVTYQATTSVISEREGPVAGSIVSVSGADVNVVYGLSFTPGQSPTQLQSRVRSLNTRRGRSEALGRVETGTATVLLTNTDGELDPSNVSGSYYGDILPLRDVYVYRRENNATYWLHRGRVERYDIQWAPPETQFVGVDSADVFELLSTVILESGYATLTTALTGSNNDLTFTAREAGESGSNISVTYVVSGNNTPLAVAPSDPLQAAALVTAYMGASESEGGGGGLGAWRGGKGGGWSISTPTGPAVPITVTVSGSDIVVNVATDGAGAATSTASQVKAALEADADIARLITVALAPGNDGTGVVTAMAQTSLSGGTWPQESSGARINRVLDEVGWPAALRDIDDGAYEVCERGYGRSQNVSALSHIQDVAQSELGYVFVAGDGSVVYHDGQHRATASRSTASQATFTDGVGGDVGILYQRIVPALDKARIVNEVTVRAGLSTSLEQTVEDTDSQAAYGRRTMSVATQLASDADALAVAQAIVDSYAEPQVAFDELTVMRRADVSGWAEAVFRLEIGDLVTVRTNPPSHDTLVSYEAFIEEIAWQVDPGSPWQATIRLTSASQSATPGGGGGGGTGGGALFEQDGVSDLLLDDATYGQIG